MEKKEKKRKSNNNIYMPVVVQVKYNNYYI